MKNFRDITDQEELEKIIIECSILYYSTGKSPLTDAEFDELIQHLRLINSEHPILPFLESMGERYALCPATTKKEYYS